MNDQNTAAQVNAFYGPDRNGLWIPAGILQVRAAWMYGTWYGFIDHGMVTQDMVWFYRTWYGYL